MSDQSPVAKVEAFGRKHRNALLAGGAAGVGGLALLLRHRTGGSAAADSGPTPTSASAVGQPADPYSSVAYDVYDALQPQLEQATGQLQTEIDSANTRIAALSKQTTAATRNHQPRPHPGTKRAAPEHAKHKTAKPSPKKPAKTSVHKTGKVSQPKLVNPRKPKGPSAVVRKLTPPKKATKPGPRKR